VGEAALVRQDAHEGALLVEQLDASGFRLTAAFWAHDAALDIWRLVLAAPRLSAPSPRAAYSLIQTAINELDLSISLDRVTFVPDTEPLIGTLRDFAAAASSDIIEVPLPGADIAGAPVDIAMETVGQRLSWVTRGELALAQGKPDVALDIARRLSGNSSPDGQYGMPMVALLQGKALTALGRFDEAEVWLSDATLHVRAQGARTALRRVLTHQTALYQQMGRADDAARAANEARELAYQMAETIPDAVLRAVFLRQCLASLPPEPKRSAEIARAASLMLTAREREVATLVAQGKSNRAIADELVISERTTESHVTNILGKLGFNSRAQIAAWAVDIGLTQPGASQTLLSAPSHRARRPATRRSR